MYVPAQFEEKNLDALYDLINNNALGCLMTQHDGRLNANHIPFELCTETESLGVLKAHIARENPLFQQLQDQEEVLVVFQADQGYISPNWYPEKLQHHRAVPTWNYRVVHARGRIRIHDDEKFLRGLLARLTRQHEATQPQPWKMSDAPADYIAEQLCKIVGIEIEITDLQGKFKISQNRSLEDRQGVVNGLTKQGSLALAQSVQGTLTE